MVFYTTHPLLQVKTEDLEAVSDGGLSEELEDVSEDEELKSVSRNHIFKFALIRFLGNFNISGFCEQF